MSRPISGCPMEVVMYRADTSQVVCAAGAPNATAIGTSATAMIEELMGLRTHPNTIGANRRRSNPPSESV